MLSAADAPRIATAFGLGEAALMTGPVARGVIGQIWRMETERGAWAVKEWFEPPDTDELAEGVAFQEAAIAAGVPAPSVVSTPAGSWRIDLDGAPVRVQGWVDLQDADPSVDPEAVGQLVGALHQVPFIGRQLEHEWYTEPIGAERWDALVAASRVAGAPFAERLAARRDELVALDALIVPPGQTRTCHRDLWSDNLRATTAGGLCLIDWEDCGLADPSMELALVLWEFGRSDPARARALHNAYVDAGGPGRVRSRSDFSMLIAQLGHIGARACADWLAAENEEARAFAASWFAEFVDDPHTMEQITMLLDTVRS
jgi:aminoglycoside phosphotransferase (APT) family kinase protein